MSRAGSFLGRTLALFSAYLGATSPQELMKAEPSCLAFINVFDQEPTHVIARQIYEVAFRLSLDKKYLEAEKASSCAAWLDHGSKNWAFDAKSLIK